MATIKIRPQPCGQHIEIEITHGAQVRTFTVTKASLKSANKTVDKDFEAILQNLIIFCRLSGSTPWAELKTQIEAKTFQV